MCCLLGVFNNVVWSSYRVFISIEKQCNEMGEVSIEWGVLNGGWLSDNSEVK